MRPVGFARRAASRTRRASPACEPDVRVEPLREPGVRPCLARRAALRTWRAVEPRELLLRISASELAVCVELPRKLGARPCLASCSCESRRANLMCSPRHLANPGARSCLASHSCESRRANPSCALSRFVKPLCELPPPTSDGGKISPWCVHGRPSVAIFSRDASPAIRGNFSSWCVPGRLSVAIFSLHASPKGPRTGKAPLPGSISCQGGSLFAALAPRIIHGALILPRSPHCTDPSNHAQHANLARDPSNHAQHANLARALTARASRISPGSPS